MATDFSRTLSLLRQEKGVSQRKAAAELGISQALLSHYENGIREPGLAFVTRACDYYHVSADYLLGRTLSRDGSIIEAGDVYDSSGEKGSLRGSIMATLQKKLVVNTVSVLFDQLGKTGSREAGPEPGPFSWVLRAAIPWGPAPWPSCIAGAAATRTSSPCLPGTMTAAWCRRT